MVFDLPYLRLVLYSVLGIFSIVLLGLSAARLHYTTHLPPGDTLNGGNNFYDPIAAELLVTTLFTIPWSMFTIHSIHTRSENRFISTFFHEIIVLSILWLFWIVGAGVASSMWGDLEWCQHFAACKILTAMVAFAWLGWIVLSAILGVTLLFMIANGALREPFHGRWDPRASQYRNSRA